ncbi:MAG: hypothetical protein KC468_21595, partial [Myxococcales bacterium]|nr:hypothetical protein [Myxococcales bacterium]
MGASREEERRRDLVRQVYARAGLPEPRIGAARAWRNLLTRAAREPYSPLPNQILLELRDALVARHPASAYASELLAQLCDDPNELVRRRARRYLLRFNTPECRALIERMLREDARVERRVAIDAAATHLPRPVARALITPLLDDADPAIVQRALLQFIQWREPLPDELLERALEHPEALVRRYASRLAEIFSYRPTWPRTLELAFLQCDAATAIVEAFNNAHGYERARRQLRDYGLWGHPNHLVAYALLIGPPEGLRALVQLRARTEVFGPRLTILATRHNRQLLLRALLHRVAALVAEDVAEDDAEDD